MSTKEQQAKHYAKWYAKNRDKVRHSRMKRYYANRKRILEIMAIKYAARKVAA